MVSVIVLAVSTFLVIYFKKISPLEWLVQNAFSLGLLFGIGFLATHSQTRDKETWSTLMTHAVHYPYWQEHYTTQEAVYTTDSKGNSVLSHYETVDHYVDHPEHWKAFWATGSGKHFDSGEVRISRAKFNEIVKNFSNGEIRTVRGHRPDFEKGDRNDYHAEKLTDYEYPMTTLKTFENRVKAAPSTLSFQTLSKSELARTYEWPENNDPFDSERLLGTARNLVKTRDWDLMNSFLGPRKKVNVIMIGWLDEGMEVAHLQEARWIGGRKNDLVICFGGATATKPPTWVYVFGWTDQDLVKVNLQSKLVTSKIDNDIIPVIEEEVLANYEIKEWRDFDYLRVETPAWVMVTQVCLQIALAIIGYWFHMNNDLSFATLFNRRRYGYYR